MNIQTFGRIDRSLYCINKKHHHVLVDELTDSRTDDHFGKNTWTYLRVNSQRDGWTDRGTDAYAAEMPNYMEKLMND